jgi:rhodanese-related sulfurtransferase
VYLKFPSLSKPEIVAGCAISGVNSIMGGNISRFIWLREASAVALIFSLLAVFFLSFLTISAMAGTETGEFCPTCVDWTNVEGWLAKKDAYEQAQLNSQQSGKQSGQLNGQASNIPTTAKANPQEKGYAMPELFTSAASIKSDQVILDVRSMPDYLSGHIPGSRSLYWKDLQRNGILDQAQAKRALGRAGVNESVRLSSSGLYAIWGIRMSACLTGALMRSRKQELPSPQTHRLSSLPTTPPILSPGSW